MPTELKPYNEERLPHGYWEIYFDNGQLDYRGEFINGTTHGFHESYWDTGRLFFIGSFDMGKRIGYWKISQDSWNEVIYKLFYAN